MKEKEWKKLYDEILKAHIVMDIDLDSLLHQYGEWLIGGDEQVEYYNGPDAPPAMDAEANVRNEHRAEQHKQNDKLL